MLALGMMLRKDLWVRFGLDSVALLLGCVPAALASHRVADGAGRSVLVPDHPQRIICLAPNLADDAFRLGAGPQVVAVSSFTHIPEQAAQRTSIGSPATPSLETIVALHPDLVLATDGMNRLETVHLLEQRGIAVFVVKPVGLDGVYRSLEQLGDALDHRAQATELVRTLQAQVAAMRRASASREPRSAVVVLWADPVFTIGKPAYLTQLLNVAGVHSVTADMPQEWPQVSLESVIARQPQWLVLVRGTLSLEQLAALPGWSDLPAVRNKKVLYVDESIELPSPACFAALQVLEEELERS